MNALSRVRYIVQNIVDSYSLQKISSLQPGYLPWSSSAMRPRSLELVMNDIIINDHSTIVELGGGVSTLMIAKLLSAQNKGHLYTVEDNKVWSDKLNNWLDKFGVRDFCTVISAPLSGSSIHDRNKWYCEEAVKKGIGGAHINTLLVDGPMAYTKDLKMARYPAVPFFKDQFADSYTVFLDDIAREGEQEILLKWGEQLNKKHRINGGLGIITTSMLNID